MPRYSPDGNYKPPERRPKPRPAGYAPQRFTPDSSFRDRPPAPRPARPMHSQAPATFEPLEPASGKQRRRMLKAAAWRLARILHLRPADALKGLSQEPKIDAAFPDRIITERRGEAARLAAKIWRLSH